MDVSYPGGGSSIVSGLFGKYKSICETKVRIGGSIDIRYYLLRGFDRGTGGDTYSIFVSKFKDGDTLDCEFAPDISADQSEARRIYSILCRNTVTPCALFEVLEDLL